MNYPFFNGKNCKIGGIYGSLLSACPAFGKVVLCQHFSQQIKYYYLIGGKRMKQVIVVHKNGGGEEVTSQPMARGSRELRRYLDGVNGHYRLRPFKNGNSNGSGRGRNQACRRKSLSAIQSRR